MRFIIVTQCDESHKERGVYTNGEERSQLLQFQQVQCLKINQGWDASPFAPSHNGRCTFPFAAPLLPTIQYSKCLLSVIPVTFIEASCTFQTTTLWRDQNCLVPHPTIHRALLSHTPPSYTLGFLCLALSLSVSALSLFLSHSFSISVSLCLFLWNFPGSTLSTWQSNLFSTSVPPPSDSHGRPSSDGTQCQVCQSPFPRGVKAKETLRRCQGLVHPASFGYPPLVFQNSTLMMMIAFIFTLGEIM